MVSTLITFVGLLTPFVFGALTCPRPDEGMVGNCAMNCFKGADCGEGEMCCNNGCGFDCMKAVEREVDAEEEELEDKSKDVWFGDLVCPKLEKGAVGHCAMICMGDSECGDGELCCSNGCGMQCTQARKLRGDKADKGRRDSSDEGEDKPDFEFKPRRPDSDLKCPKVDSGVVGHCAEMCFFDQDCGEGELCCSNGCGKQCTKAVKKSQKPGMCPRSKKQKCKRMCPELTCGEDECLMRNDNCCDLTCEKKAEKPAEKPEMCPASQEQFCRRMCPDVSCGEDECLMRNDNCCDLTCEKKEEKPATCDWESSVCDPENDQCAEGYFCNPKACVPSVCNCEMIDGKPSFMCTADCNPGCVKGKKKGDKKKPATCDWKSSVCDPKDDQCADGYVCDPEACVPSQCNCEMIDGKPSFMCTEDCNPGCVKDDNKPAICNEDRHCGFLSVCFGGRCAPKAEVSFDDVQYDCASIYGDEDCQASGCGKKAGKNGRCVPKSAGKISCKTLGDNEGLCGLLQCKFKKGKCGGKSKLE